LIFSFLWTQNYPWQIQALACWYYFLTVGKLAKRIDISDHTALIIHRLIRIIDMSSNTPMVVNKDVTLCMETICSLMRHLDRRFIVWIPMVSKVVQKYKIVHEKFNALMKALEEPEVHIPIEEYNDDEDLIQPPTLSSYTPVEMNETRLKQAWETTSSWNGKRQSYNQQFREQLASFGAKVNFLFLKATKSF